uniref:Zinc finger protein 513 n=1 Tax=Cacopsylla melanoneura TaxID=428564 RepID=A0A8D8YX56_9HEMI
MYLVIFADSCEENQKCIHCSDFSTQDISFLVSHCRTCSAMPRPDPFRQKFVCYACDYYTYLLGNIKSHIRKHTGEKPYKCKACPYKVATLSGLQSHEKFIHSKQNVHARVSKEYTKVKKYITKKPKEK